MQLNRARYAFVLSLIALFAVAAAGGMGAIRTSAQAACDLTAPGARCDIRGAVFRQGALDKSAAALSGVFLRLNGAAPGREKPIIQGYNSDYRPTELDGDADPRLNRALPLAEIPLVPAPDGLYRQFVLDIDQLPCDPAAPTACRLSLDALRLFVSTSPTLHDYQDGVFADGIAPDMVFDLAGESVIMDGSPAAGRGDMFFYLPERFFDRYPGCGFGVAGCEYYVYLYSRFGAAHGNNGGPEAWAAALQPGFGRLTIVKQARPAPDGSFSFSLTGPGEAGAGLVLDATTPEGGGGGSGRLTLALPPGVYALTENTTPGWITTAAACEGDGDGDPAAFEIVAGGEVTCTFVSEPGASGGLQSPSTATATLPPTATPLPMATWTPTPYPTQPVLPTESVPTVGATVSPPATETPGGGYPSPSPPATGTPGGGYPPPSPDSGDLAATLTVTATPAVSETATLTVTATSDPFATGTATPDRTTTETPTSQVTGTPADTPTPFPTFTPDPFTPEPTAPPLPTPPAGTTPEPTAALPTVTPAATVPVTPPSDASATPVMPTGTPMATATATLTPAAALPTGICPAGAAANEMTTILGAGMGSADDYFAAARVNLPDHDDILALYGQIAGKDEGKWDHARFLYPNGDFENVRRATSPAYRKWAVFWYGAELEPASFIRGRLIQPDQTSIARALVLYPTYRTDAPYAGAFRVFDESAENMAYWFEPGGWTASRQQTLDIPAPLGLTDVTVMAALVDNDDDGRAVTLTAEAGGASASITATGPTDGPLLNIVTLVLRDVPAGTSRITLALTSPQNKGDSVALIGATASYACGTEGEGATETPEPAGSVAPPTTESTATPSATVSVTPPLTPTPGQPYP